MSKRKKDLTLTKIFVGVIVIGGGLYALLHLGRNFVDQHFGPKAMAAAQEKIGRARTLAQEGSPEQARELLQTVIERIKEPAAALDALLILVDIEEQAGNSSKALQALARAHRDSAGTARHPEIAVRYARLLEQSGQDAQALPIYEEVRDSAPPEIRAPALIGLGRHAERGGGLIAAREAYRQAIGDAVPDSAVWDEAVDALGKVNVALIFSNDPLPESKIYTVVKGDSITGIGNALNTTQGLLLRANRLNEKSTLRIGQRLKFTPKDFRIIIDRAGCRLFLVDKDGLFKRYSVGLGKPGHETSLGSYKIGNKEKNPTWHKPGVGPIPPGDPKNELGTRWMPLVPVQDGLPRDLGIHGTIAPKTIGKYSSSGCIRMYCEDVEELYDLVVRSTPVDIVENYTWKGARDVPMPAARIPNQTL
ncbi:MAG: L,D-transpeptidase family protein [Nitrospiraceae bacterium]|nr:L,D-transpeptidase family protein [Nitrospiraceae bacterium]